MRINTSRGSRGWKKCSKTVFLGHASQLAANFQPCLVLKSVGELVKAVNNYLKAPEKAGLVGFDHARPVIKKPWWPCPRSGTAWDHARRVLSAS